MILLAEKECPVDSFVNRYPLVEELEVKIVSPAPRLVGRGMRQLGEHLFGGGCESRLWYMRKRAGGVFCVGFHAPLDQHGVLRDRLDAWNAADSGALAVSRLPSDGGSGKVSILKRLPFAVSDSLAAQLLKGFVAACQLSVAYLSTSPDEGLGTWGRILYFTHAIEAAFDALGLSGATRSAYATFHRDWIVRFLVLRAGKSDTKAREILELLKERALALAQVLDASKAEEQPAPPATEETPGLLESWLEQVVAGCGWAQDEPTLDPLPDPFAPDARSLMLFQLLHVLAQALDLQPLEEALALTVVSLAPHSGESTPLILTLPALEPESTSSPESLDPAPTSHRAVWMLLVQAGGDQGREFLKRFQQHAGTEYGKSAEALELLRKHELGVQRLERAAALLEQVRETVRIGTDESDPLQLLLGRFFLGSEAYFHYCAGDLALAEEILLRAGASLEHAIDREACLAPCAPLNADIPLQRARIARRRNDWNGVVRELSLLADLETGRRPLHRRPEGPPIDYELIGHLCQVNPRLSEADRAVLHQYIAPEHRIPRLNRWIRGFYAPKGLLIFE